MLDDLLVGEYGETNSVLLAIRPASDVSTAIVKEVNSLSILQIILIVSMVGSARHPHVGTETLLSGVLPVSNEASFIRLDSCSITINFIFAVVSDVPAFVGEDEFSEAIHLTYLHLASVGLTIGTLMNAKVFPVVIEPESFVFSDVITALVDAVASRFTFFPLSIINVVVNMNYTTLSVLTVVLPHAAVSGAFRLDLFTIPMLDFSVFLDLALVNSAIFFTDHLFDNL